MKKIFLISILNFIVPHAEAIRYYKSNSQGVIQSIYEKDLSSCLKIIYRKSGKDDLPMKEKKLLLHALIRGEVINSLPVLKNKLKNNPEYCSYGADDEKISD